MDIEAYITSGILESYAMGFASPQERREVECLSSIYPELKTELTRIQTELEKLALGLAVTPPAANKQAILDAIHQMAQEEPSDATTEQQAPAKESKVIPLTNRYLKLAVAASVLALLGLGYFYQDLQSENLQLSENITRIQNQNQSQFADLQSEIQKQEAESKILLAEATRSIELAGTDLNPEAKAKIWWNAQEQKFILKSDQLPAPSSGKQYQLWAIVDGKPQSMGVFSEQLLIADEALVAEAQLQAFAITLEPEGGSVNPTLEAMVVIGNT